MRKLRALTAKRSRHDSSRIGFFGRSEIRYSWALSGTLLAPDVRFASPMWKGSYFELYHLRCCCVERGRLWLLLLLLLEGFSTVRRASVVFITLFWIVWIRLILHHFLLVALKILVYFHPISLMKRPEDVSISNQPALPASIHPIISVNVIVRTDLHPDREYLEQEDTLLLPLPQFRASPIP